ncbi:hypothetical protein HDU98_009217 [Podochytrium sp. JEL0797]|nr:hypothetical protein HDU98_009217 [Podochytrium sp. JEL0797]
MTPEELTLSQHRASLTSKPETIGMPVTAAKRRLRALIGSKWTDEKFTQHWDLLYHRVLTGPEHFSDASTRTGDTAGSVAPPQQQQQSLTTTVDDSGRHRLLITTSPLIYSLPCTARRTLHHLAQRYWPQIVGTSICLLLAMAGYQRARVQRREEVVVAAIVEDVLDCLHAESENHRVDPRRFPVSGLSVAMVRDHFVTVAVGSGAAGKTGKVGAGVLDAYGFVAALDKEGRSMWTVADSHMKARVWKKVSKCVVRNANVRESVMEVQGEEDLVWQWIGSFALSPKRRQMVPPKGGGGGSGKKGGPSVVPGSIRFDETTMSPSVRKSKVVAVVEEDVVVKEEAVEISEVVVGREEQEDAGGDVSYPSV